MLHFKNDSYLLQFSITILIHFKQKFLIAEFINYFHVQGIEILYQTIVETMSPSFNMAQTYFLHILLSNGKFC